MTPLKNAIYHNPRCRKSRETLALLHDQGFKPEIIEYLKTPPSESDLGEICRLLDVRPKEIIRTKEALFKELGLSLKDERSDAEWIAIMSRHPKLIERPIVVRSGKAALGRPPENVLDLF